LSQGSINTADSVTRLIERLSSLPGIGPKSAQRLAYYLLRAPEEQTKNIGEAILNLKQNTHLCSSCFNISDGEFCPVCLNKSRSKDKICVVEQPQDVFVLEHIGIYKGLYHVLHGAIAPADGITTDSIRINELLQRLKEGGVEEVILATNPTTEGETTALYLQRLITPLGIKLTRLARGLPFGTEIEYADDVTLSRALEGRQEL
jgi:recombination protein RecR